MGPLHVLSRRSAGRRTLSDAGLPIHFDPKLGLLDVSNQALRDLPMIITERATTLEHLVADGNALDEASFERLILDETPTMKRLKTLSLNANKVRDPLRLLLCLQRLAPRLEFLSLIGNPGWHHALNPIYYSPYLYHQERLLAARLLPRLQFLDCQPMVGRSSSRKKSAPAKFSISGGTKSALAVEIDSGRTICGPGEDETMQLDEEENSMTTSHASAAASVASVNNNNDAPLHSCLAAN